jgi:Flp pilus assembly protein TadB
MPFVLGTIFTLNDPASMSKVFQSPYGLAILGAAMSFQFLGGFIIWKILNIKM